jgi:hypothetical protein
MARLLLRSPSSRKLDGGQAVRNENHVEGAEDAKRTVQHRRGKQEQ